MIVWLKMDRLIDGLCVGKSAQCRRFWVWHLRGEHRQVTGGATTGNTRLRWTDLQSICGWQVYPWTRDWRRQEVELSRDHLSPITAKQPLLYSNSWLFIKFRNWVFRVFYVIINILFILNVSSSLNFNLFVCLFRIVNWGIVMCRRRNYNLIKSWSQAVVWHCKYVLSRAVSVIQTSLAFGVFRVL